MRYRVTFLLGLGVGYILGTRAGREQYERLRRVSVKVAKSPVVTEAVSGARDEARQQWQRMREGAARRQVARGDDGDDDTGAGRHGGLGASASAGLAAGVGRLGRLTSHVPHTFGRRTTQAVSHSSNGASDPAQWRRDDWTDGQDESDHMP